MRQVLALAHAELLHIVRDRATLAQALIVPLLQLIVLANAATFEIRDTPTWIVDLDRTSVSRGLVARLTSSGHLRPVSDVPSTARADEGMLAGRVTLIVVIPAGFAADVARQRTGGVGLVVNAEKGSSAGIVQAYAGRIITDYAAELSGPAAAPPRIEVRQQSRYNPTLNYQYYMVPGILVALITMIGTLLTAQNIAREKELGTLEQLNVTPITRGRFIAGKLLPFWGLALVELAFGLVVGRLVFGMPMRGSVLLLFGSAAVYLLVTLSLGLWISTIVDTQQQAMFVTFFVLNIYLLLSGLFTPIDSMAPWVQLFSQVNPVRHFVAIARAILMKGAGLGDIARPLTILAVYAVVALTFAVRQYRKRTA